MQECGKKFIENEAPMGLGNWKCLPCNVPYTGGAIISNQAIRKVMIFTIIGFFYEICEKFLENFFLHMERVFTQSISSSLCSESYNIFLGSSNISDAVSWV